MGQFSWLYCDTKKQVVVDKIKKSYLLIPKEFGGGKITESCYEGHGVFGHQDVFELVADWNREWVSKNPDLKTADGFKLSDNQWYPFYADLSLSKEQVIEKWCKWRYIGIDLVSMDDINTWLKYPIKIAELETSVYEECEPSEDDPNLGCEQNVTNERSEKNYVWKTMDEVIREITKLPPNVSLDFTFDVLEDEDDKFEPTGWYGVKMVNLFGEPHGCLCIGYFGGGATIVEEIHKKEDIDNIFKNFCKKEEGREVTTLCVSTKYNGS